MRTLYLYKELLRLDIALKFFISKKDGFERALNEKKQIELKDKIEFLRQKDLVQAARIKKLAVADLFFEYLKNFSFFQKLSHASKDLSEQKKLTEKLKITSAILSSLKQQILSIEDELKEICKLREAGLTA